MHIYFNKCSVACLQAKLDANASNVVIKPVKTEDKNEVKEGPKPQLNGRKVLFFQKFLKNINILKRDCKMLSSAVAPEKYFDSRFTHFQNTYSG